MTDFLLMVAGALFAMFVSGIVNYKKSTWVGLTEEELSDCMDMSIQKTCRAIEAKLKAKNT